MDVRTIPVALAEGGVSGCAVFACAGCGVEGCSCALKRKGPSAKKSKNRKPIRLMREAIGFGKRPRTF